MGDVSIKNRIIRRTFQPLFQSRHGPIKSKRLAIFYYFLSLLSVPARSGKRQTRGRPHQQLPRLHRDLQDPATRRADFCRRVRLIIAKIRHQKNTVLTQDSSEICTDPKVEKRTDLMASLPLQGTWTNSWTCWTSGMLVEKDQSLDLDLEPTSTMTSSTLPRLIQKPGGQFDTDMDIMTTEYGHINKFNNMDKESLLFEDMDLAMPADAAMSEDDFLNSFMDLSEFLLPVHPAEETDEVPNVISLEEDLNNFLAYVEPVPLEAVVCEEVVPPEVFVKREIDDIDSDWSLNNDHDYVTKKPRLSPTPCVADLTKKPKSTQSASEPAVQKSTPDQKYRERRIKNNIASRRSREIRKNKFSEMDEEANRLEIANAKLRVKIEEMEKVAKEMKALLVQKLAAK